MSFIPPTHLAIHTEYLITCGIAGESQLTIKFMPTSVPASEELDPI